MIFHPIKVTTHLPNGGLAFLVLMTSEAEPMEKINCQQFQIRYYVLTTDSTEPRGKL